MTVIELPGDHVATRPEFDAQVRTHAGMVYQAALRQMRDAHLAADVTQAVFLIFFRKYQRLPARTIVSAWLLRTTRYACLTALQQSRRRKFHEREAAVMRQRADEAVEHDEDWTTLLDAALDLLGRKDREAIAMTYFEGASHKELARQAGISEAAAHKRVQRAIERLREKLKQQGGTMSTAARDITLGFLGQQSAPAGIVQGVMTCVSGQAPAGVQTIVKGTAMMMKTLMAKVMMTAVVGALLVGGYSMAQGQTGAGVAAPAGRGTDVGGHALPAVRAVADEVFEPVVTLTLEGAADFAVDLQKGEFLPPMQGVQSPMDIFDTLSEMGADVWLKPRRGDIAVMGVELMFVSMGAARMEQPESADDFMMQMLMTGCFIREMPWVAPRVAAMPGSGSAAFRFRTRGGAMGMMVVKAAEGDAKPVLQIRMMRPAVRTSAAALAAWSHVLPDLEGAMGGLEVEMGEAGLKKAKAVSRRVRLLEELMRGTEPGVMAQKLDLLCADMKQPFPVRMRTPPKQY